MKRIVRLLEAHNIKICAFWGDDSILNKKKTFFPSSFNKNIRPKSYRQKCWFLNVYIDPVQVILNPKNNTKYIAQHIAHELGHYFIAPKGRRHRVNYGITLNKKRSAASKKGWDIDELKAQYVENHILKWARMPYRKDIFRMNRPLRHLKPQVSQWWINEGQSKIDKILKKI